MANTFILSFKAECLKKKGSLASWIVFFGAFFTPTIIVIARLINYKKAVLIYENTSFWTILWGNSWESMAIFLLPFVVILSTSLISQIEYKNNTWKQLHCLPLPFTIIFLSKLVLIIVMLLQFFVLFNFGIFLSAVLPNLLIPKVYFPISHIPYSLFINENVLFFIDCLPIVALQYLLSLQYKNFLVSVGIGFLFWVGALASLSWKFGYLVPYTYCMFNYLKDKPGGKVVPPDANIHFWAIGYFILISIISYILYIKKIEKS